ncbi:hypothetical protein L1049_024984 [Liquidambar formosana]|uniref:1-deoxy-D-xylulose-5-phosphate synthase n=1 Tax=Liquidambar formosana TaxID=63359 RepID=A0AAP0RVA9_LIQFO
MAVSGYIIRANPPISPCLKSPGPILSCRKQLLLAGSSDGEEGKITMRRGKDGWKIDFSGENPETPLLDTINYPVHMKNLSTQDLEQLAAELRADIVYTVSNTGGHLSASLGVVELAVALHHVFNTPEDKIIWDVGRQVYPHKILTGRRSKMHTIRKTSGLAGFPKRDRAFMMLLVQDTVLQASLLVLVSLPTATLDGPATPVGALSSALTKLQASPKFRKLREAAKVYL